MFQKCSRLTLKTHIYNKKYQLKTITVYKKLYKRMETSKELTLVLKYHSLTRDYHHSQTFLIRSMVSLFFLYVQIPQINVKILK